MKDGNFKNKRMYQNDVITKWMQDDRKNITKLARNLGCSRQNAYRLIEKYKSQELLIDHKLVNRSKTDKTIVKKVVDEYLDYCQKSRDFRKDGTFIPNFKIFNDFVLKPKLNLSNRTIHNYLISNLIFSPDSRKKTKKKIRKEIKEKNNDKKEILNLIDIENKEMMKIKPYKTKKTGIFGDVVEIDACQHQWFNDEKFHLYAAVDRKSGFILATHLEKEETTKGYYFLLGKLFKNHGKPRLIITDKRRTFWADESSNTLFKESLINIGIELQSSSQATAKPNVERAFRNLQDVYPAMFYRDRINNFDEAILKLDEYQQAYNLYFQKTYESENNFLPVILEEIENNMNLKYRLKVRNGSFVFFKNEFLAPFNEQGQRYLMNKNETVIVHSRLDDNSSFVFWKGKKLELKPISEFDIFFEFGSEQEKLAKERIKIEKEKKKQRRIQVALLKKHLYLINMEKLLFEKEKQLKLVAPTS